MNSALGKLSFRAWCHPDRDVEQTLDICSDVSSQGQLDHPTEASSLHCHPHFHINIQEQGPHLHLDQHLEYCLAHSEDSIKSAEQIKKPRTDTRLEVENGEWTA